MRIATAVLSSLSPYSQSRHHGIERESTENFNEFEEKHWRRRMHVDESGMVFIPPMALKNCLSEAAKFLSIKIPGKGKATYTKHFEAGVLVMDPVNLEIHESDVKPEWLFLPSDGRRGSGSRVMKCYPRIDDWRGIAKFYVLDDTITATSVVNGKPQEGAFERHLREAGSFIGIGRFRPRNNGYYGRFKVEKVEWSEQ